MKRKLLGLTSAIIVIVLLIAMMPAALAVGEWYVTTAKTNAYKQDSASSEVVTTIPKGATVQWIAATTTDNIPLTYVYYNGGFYFVKTANLKATSTPAVTPTPKPAPVPESFVDEKGREFYLVPGTTNQYYHYSTPPYGSYYCVRPGYYAPYYAIYDTILNLYGYNYHGIPKLHQTVTLYYAIDGKVSRAVKELAYMRGTGKDMVIWTIDSDGKLTKETNFEPTLVKVVRNSGTCDHLSQKCPFNKLVHYR